jgi:glycosyltransferase involved in cell wall biosynthesis
MNLEILISTMNGKFQSRDITPPVPYILIDQISPDKGLAKSRNLAIDESRADICLISDDDLEYIDSIEESILNAFRDNLKADIITFEVQTPDNRPYKRYKTEPFWHTQKSIMSVSSVEIAFRRDSIMSANLKFDNRFGLGSEYPTGEEVIFLSDGLKSGLKILFIPIPIVIHPIESSGKNYDNPTLIRAKGAMFYRIFSLLGYGASLLFAFKKYKISPHSMLEFYRLMVEGIEDYRSKR